MIVRTLTASAVAIVAMVGQALSQQITFEGTAAIESQTPGCQGSFDIGRPGSAAFTPANVGPNGPFSYLAFTPEVSFGGPRVSALSLAVQGPLQSGASYNASEIAGNGSATGFSGTIHTATVTPSTITPTTPMVKVFAIIQNPRGIPGCTIRVRAGFVNGAG